MDAIKRFFGVLLLGVAIWLTSSLVTAQVYMLLWAVLLIVCAIYVLALLRITSTYARLWKGAGVIALVAGVALLIGAFSGEQGIFHSLAQLTGTANPVQKLEFQRVKNNAVLDQAISQARGRYVMLDFYADWCVSCKEMELSTFSDAAVQARLKTMQLLQADVTANTADDAALLKRFVLFGPPGILFFDEQGNEIKTRVIGYQNPEKFLVTLNSVMQ